jgi:hypothetical protein
MGQVSAETWVQLALWFAVLFGLIILATLIVQRLRGRSADAASPSELMTDFQEMRQRGDLSEADYKKVKSVLGTRIQPRSGDQRKHH